MAYEVHVGFSLVFFKLSNVLFLSLSGVYSQHQLCLYESSSGVSLLWCIDTVS